MRSSLLLATALLTACGPGVHDLSVSSEPLLTVRGRVDLDSLTRVHPDAPLIAALVWAAKPAVAPICVKYAARSVLQGACADPYGVFLGDLEAEVVLDPDGDGSFELHLARLPDARVAVGDSSNRIAYGTVVLVEDLDRNGHATLVDSAVAPPGPHGEPIAGDRIIAASFYNLKRPQQRLVFREGQFDSGSYFYPAPECEPPPPGFSLLKSEGMGVEGGCAVEGVEETTIELQPIVGVDDQIACRANFIDSGGLAGFTEASHEAYLEPGPWVICLDRETIAQISSYSALCKGVTFYLLKGCMNDPFCDSPEWDYTNDVPEWWPC